MVQFKSITLVAVCITAIIGYAIFTALTPYPYPYKKGDVITLKLDGRNAVVVGTARDYLMVKFAEKDEEVKVYPAEIWEKK